MWNKIKNFNIKCFIFLFPLIKQEIFNVKMFYSILGHIYFVRWYHEFLEIVFNLQQIAKFTLLCCLVAHYICYLNIYGIIIFNSYKINLFTVIKCTNCYIKSVSMLVNFYSLYRINIRIYIFYSLYILIYIIRFVILRDIVSQDPF